MFCNTGGRELPEFIVAFSCWCVFCASHSRYISPSSIFFQLSSFNIHLSAFIFHRSSFTVNVVIFHKHSCSPQVATITSSTRCARPKFIMRKEDTSKTRHGTPDPHTPKKQRKRHKFRCKYQHGYRCRRNYRCNETYRINMHKQRQTVNTSSKRRKKKKNVLMKFSAHVRIFIWGA